MVSDLPLNIADPGDNSPYIILDPNTGRLIDLSIDPCTGKRRKYRIPLAYDQYGAPIWAYNPQGLPVCGALRTQDPGCFCHDPRRDDDGLCPKHRDLSDRSRRVKENALVLENSPNGRYGKYLPKQLQEDLATLQRSPRLLEMDENIAMIDVHLQQLANSLQGGLDVKSWEKLDQLRNEAAVVLGTAYPSAPLKLEKLQVIMQKILVMMESGGRNTKIFDDMAKASLIRAKLVETEQRRRKDAQNMIPADQAYQLFAQVLAIIRRNIRDRHVLEAIATEIDKLAYMPTNRAILHGTVDLNSFEMSTEATEVLTSPGPDLKSLDEIQKDTKRLRKEVIQEAKAHRTGTYIDAPEELSEEEQLRQLAGNLGFDINRLDGVEPEDED